MKKAIGYIRVSTEQQATQGVSLEAQQEKIKAWCLLQGYTLVKIHTDAGISGKSMGNRPALKAALEEIEDGDALVVYSLSRLARSTKDALMISEKLNKRGADLVSLSEHIDTTTAAGKMVFRMLAVLNEFERDLVSERTKAALDQKKASGQKYAPVPYGFKEVEGRLVELKEEAKQVKHILVMRNEGQTYAAIADDMNLQGIPGKRGGQWYPSTVRYLIQRQSA